MSSASVESSKSSASVESAENAENAESAESAESSKSVSIEEKYKFTTNEESVKEKDWAAGSSKVMDFTEFVVGVGICTVSYPPALWKIVDETVVNALDHLVRMQSTDTPVTEISLDYTDGVISVFNNGPGIEVVVHKTASEHFGKTTYVPTFIFGTLFQGSNRVKTEDSIIGGTNGVGAKIANCMSTVFTLETVDPVRKLKFKQTWRDGMSKCEDPVITKYTKSPFTRLTFTPDYAHFGYSGTAAGGDTADTAGGKTGASPKLLPADEETLRGLFHTRMHFAAAYAHFTSPKCRILFNNKVISTKSSADIATLMFPDSPQITCVMKPSGVKAVKSSVKAVKAVKSSVKPVKAVKPVPYPWDITIVFTRDSREISNVNGVVVKSGKHTKYIVDTIQSEVKTKINTLFNNKDLKFTPSQVSSNICIVLNAKIPNPSWTGQRKDELDYDSKRFTHKFPPAVIKRLITGFTEILSQQVFDKQPTATGRKRAVANSREYHGADSAGTKESSKCILIPVEGNSAMGNLESAIANTHGFKHIGLISTKGVIMNARTKSSVKQLGDTQYITKTKQLEENIFFKRFCDSSGLCSSYKYIPGSPTYAKEMKELRYGKVCVAVDQDLDGKGNILGSILSMFEYWWPNLLSAGYVQWFCTPIIRAYPAKGGVVLQFYSEPEYDRWIVHGELSGSNAGKYGSKVGKVSSHGKVGKASSSSKVRIVPTAATAAIGTITVPKPNVQNFNIRYYKGLGTHEREESIAMMKDFYNTIITYTVDTDTTEAFNIYFGSNPDLRKLELSQPTVVPSPERVLAQFTQKSMSCTEHLRWDTNMYQKDNIERKLDHIIDGQNQAGRKILDGLMLAFKTSNTGKKVAVLAGFITEKKNYHHGEESLCKSITGKGFIGPGGKQLPILIPMSNFGTRSQGGNDASAPRYVVGKLNNRLVHLLFPKLDYCLLDFSFDEGNRGEPKYFIPIIPLAVCESTDMPAHGWKITTWARDVQDVITNCKNKITIANAPTIIMRPCVYEGAPFKWTGTFKTIRGKMYSFGTYTVATLGVADTLIITELPLRDWTSNFMDNLAKLSGVYFDILDVKNHSTDYTIEIHIPLKPGAVELIEELGDYPFTSGVEEYFGLRSRMCDHLNFMGADGGVKSLTRYEEVFDTWFPVRATHYAKRIERQMCLARCNILYYDNLIRFITSDLRLSKCKISTMKEMLATEKYDKFSSVLKKPLYTPNHELEAAILDGTYDYILKLTEYSKSEESLQEYAEKRSKYQVELDLLQSELTTDRFPGATQWMRELDELSTTIKEGMKTAWKFGEHDMYVL
jgi:DNA topoisomerase-2